MRGRLIAGGVSLLLCVGLPASADAHTLSYSQAKRAAKARADSIAGQRTRVGTMLRMSRHRWYVQAKWTKVDPSGCVDCDYDPITERFRDTETRTPCFVGLYVSFRSARSHRVRTSISEEFCP